MKYPNPTFLKTASRVRDKRRIRTIIVIVCIVVLALISLFVWKMASMQDMYRKDFPQLVGAATSTTTTKEEIISKVTRETTLSSEIVTTVSSLEPSFASATETESTEVTESTVQNNTQDDFCELEENIYFKNKHPLQTVTHDLRDQYLDDLKQSLEEYINGNCTSNNERVCIFYSNLSCNETMGVNELAPIVPAGSFALPVEMVYYSRVLDGTSYPYDVVTYNEAAMGNSSYITDTYDYGKNFYLRSLAYYAIAMNDNVALSMLINRVGGEDYVLDKISDVSNYIDYSQPTLYQNYLGQTIQGPSRSSCYDMTMYAREVYFSYKSNPEIYQSLINDMSDSRIPTAYITSFGDDSIILHSSGRNETLNAYTDLAIIDCEEPIVLCIYAECASYDRALVITTDLSMLVSNYIESLH